MSVKDLTLAVDLPWLEQENSVFGGASEVDSMGWLNTSAGILSCVGNVRIAHFLGKTKHRSERAPDRLPFCFSPLQLPCRPFLSILDLEHQFSEIR